MHRFPSLVAQASASTGSREITDARELFPKDTECPIFPDEVHIESISPLGSRVDEISGTSSSPEYRTATTGSLHFIATSPSLSSTMYPHPMETNASRTYLSTAPATAAMGPTSAADEASHIHWTIFSSFVDALYGS